MIIQHNLMAANAQRMLNIVNKRQSTSVKKLSSGYRINSAADDAAGLSISEKMRAQIKGLNKASTNAQDGISLIHVADGALNEVHSVLQRMNELTVQAANDTNTSNDRDNIKDEIDQLAMEIDRIASTTEFNTMKLFDGSFKTKNLQVGANSNQLIELDIKAMDTHGLGLAFNLLDPNIDKVLQIHPSIKYIEIIDETDTAYYPWQSMLFNTQTKNPYISSQNLLVNSHGMAEITMKFVQNAVDLVSEMRSSLGAVENRLEHTISNLDNASENLAASESKIRDTDMADEIVKFSTNSILAQAGQSMLAQANQQTQGIVALLH